MGASRVRFVRAVRWRERFGRRECVTGTYLLTHIEPGSGDVCQRMCVTGVCHGDVSPDTLLSRGPAMCVSGYVPVTHTGPGEWTV